MAGQHRQWQDQGPAHLPAHRWAPRGGALGVTWGKQSRSTRIQGLVTVFAVPVHNACLAHSTGVRACKRRNTTRQNEDVAATAKGKQERINR